MSLPTRHRRILVIDDSEAIHLDFHRILLPERGGGSGELDALEVALFGPEAARASPPEEVVFEVDSAFQGQEGLAKVRESLEEGRPYALAFLDYRMPPGWNGAQTLRQLRVAAPSLPVVLCSAYSDFSWAEVVRQCGGPAPLRELRKPFNGEAAYQLALSLSAGH